MKRAHVVAAAAAGVVIAGAGGAFAATQLDSPTARSQAIITDAAGQLNIDPSKLTSALEKAIDDQIDAAVRTGKLTSAQGAALKARVDSGQVPLVAGLGLRHVGFGRGAGPGVLGGRLGFGFRAFGAAAVSVASYLGISIDELRTEFGSGKTLAQIAVAHGKTSDGLVTALLADAGKRLDTAVSTGRLTSAGADGARKAESAVDERRRRSLRRIRFRASCVRPRPQTPSVEPESGRPMKRRALLQPLRCLGRRGRPGGHSPAFPQVLRAEMIARLTERLEGRQSVTAPRWRR